MKLAKSSLVVAFSLCGFMNTSLAIPLEKVMRGTDVSIFLRYRYTETYMGNREFGSYSSARNVTRASHAWRANADFTTPNMEGIALTLGIVYHNSNTRSNEGGIHSHTGKGLGAGEDSAFGVSTFFATLSPEETSTIINIGKMRVNTPLNDPLDDRATGIYASNNDVPNWTFMGGVFDAWSLDDLGKDYKDFGAVDYNSIVRELAMVGASVDYDSINAQLWHFHVEKFVNHVIFSELAYKNEALTLKGQCAISSLDGGKSLLANTPRRHMLYTIEARTMLQDGMFQNTTKTSNARSSNSLELKMGYIGSGKEGYRVSFDNQASFSTGGKIWNDGSIAGVNYSVHAGFPHSANRSDSLKLSVFYAGVDYRFSDDLSIGIDYVRGENKNPPYAINFQEITPMISYKYNGNIDFLAYYAMLHAEDTKRKKDRPASYKDSDQNRFRFEAKYHF